MRVRQIGVVILCYVFIVIHLNLNAVQKGSETSLSIEAHAVFPATDTDNKMLAFGWFKNGFTLEDDTTSCTFESVFPVSGNISFNGGTLYINTDLDFDIQANIQTLGKICGDYHVLELAETTTFLSASPYPTTLNNAKIFFYTDLNINTTLRCEGDCLLNGHKNSLLLNTDGKIIIATDSTLTVQNCTISGISEGKIICEADSSKLVLQNSRWKQDGNYSFTQGSIQIKETVKFIGAHTFTYESNQTSTIDANSTWQISKDMTFALGRQDINNGPEPLYFEDSSATLFLTNCTLNITDSGATFTRGTLLFDRNVCVELNSTLSQNGLTLGDGTSNGDVYLKFHPGGILNFKAGYINYNLAQPNALAFNDMYAKIIRDENNVLNVEQNIHLSNLIIKRGGDTSMPVADGKYATYDNCLMELSNLEFYITATKVDETSNLLAGDGELALVKGNYSGTTYIKNTNNLIRGDGHINGNIILQETGAEVTLGFNGAVDTDIQLNGNKAILNDNLAFSQDYDFKNTGTINLNNRILFYGNQNHTWTDTLYWDGSYATIKLNSDLFLSGKMTFSGICQIDGNNHKLELLPTGKIIIERGSTLLFKDINLDGIGNDNLICSDNQSKIQFDNTKLNFTDNYTFSIGHFEIFNHADFKGSYTFVYASGEASYIKPHSELSFNDDIRLEFNAPIVAPIIFDDSTAHLKLSNAEINVSSTGCQITRGTVILDNYVTFDVTSTETYNSLIIGDGTEDNDVTIQCNPAANIIFQSGAFVYNNYTSNKFISLSNSTKLTRNPGTNYAITSNQVFSNIIIEVSPYSTLTVPDGKTLEYENCTMITPQSTFKATGQRYNSYTTLLHGNDYISIQSGSLPLYTLVQGTGNKIYDNGSIDGRITLIGSGSELTFGINGLMNNDVYVGGNKIILENDLNFAKNYSFKETGTINLSSHRLILGTQDYYWTSTMYIDGDYGALILNSDLYLSSIITFSGICEIDGNKHALHLENGGKIKIEKGSILTLRNVNISKVQNDNIICEDNEGTIKLTNTKLTLDGDYTFSQGSLEISSLVEFSGSYTFALNAAKQLTINPNSELKLTGNLTIETGNTRNDPFCLSSNTSAINANNTKIKIGNLGCQLTKGTIYLNGFINLEITSTDTTKGLILGDGTSDNDCTLESNSASRILLSGGAFVYNNYAPDKFKSSSNATRLIRRAGTVYCTNSNHTLENTKIEIDPSATLIVADGKTFRYRNCTVITPQTSFVVTGERYNAYTTLLYGDCQLFMKEGTLPLYLLIQSTNNKVHGTGNILGSITFSDATAELEVSLSGEIMNNISLNGGTLTLQNNLSFINNKIIIGPGTVNLTTKNLSFGNRDTNWNQPIHWQGNDGLIELHSTTDLAATWTFEGLCTLDGHNNIMEFDSLGEIYVQENTTLILKNIYLKDAGPQKIKCANATSKIIFDNTAFLLPESNYTFSAGTMEVKNTLLIKGNSFIFHTDQPCVVNPNARISLKRGACFSYDPTSTAKNLICLSAPCSFIALKDSSLHATTTGLKLTKGTLTSNGNCNIISDATIKENGIFFGDGITADNNLNIEVDGNLTLSGQCIYQNVEA